jgi:hypothetical protein
MSFFVRNTTRFTNTATRALQIHTPKVSTRGFKSTKFNMGVHNLNKYVFLAPSSGDRACDIQRQVGGESTRRVVVQSVVVVCCCITSASRTCTSYALRVEMQKQKKTRMKR